ncbi:MAG TPA: hypothetical protein VD908_00225 [Cytophagales bacterium]|nr:hypothetical protein [Cytophagales bacterium]
MNGFTINNDRWFIDLFSFENYSSIGWDWLSDFYDSTANDLTITGFEDIQKVFQDIASLQSYIITKDTGLFIQKRKSEGKAYSASGLVHL